MVTLRFLLPGSKLMLPLTKAGRARPKVELKTPYSGLQMTEEPAPSRSRYRYRARKQAASAVNGEDLKLSALWRETGCQLVSGPR
jgi:hypothetical protein